ncbi:MAG TPA: DUF3795 domain-containing protein [Acidobacteriota bacterium]|nr:DUF3795 domain-containing protein [Acidobacteriota bacterium]
MVDLEKKCTTRRKFCKRLAGVAFTGAVVGLDSMVAQNPKLKGDAAGNGLHLAAACGTYCGACPAYLVKHGEDEEIRKKRQKISSSGPAKAQKGIPPSNWMDRLLCDGCLSGGTLAAHCQRCTIRLCALDIQNNSRCSDCEELPCHRITDLINMGNYLHRDEYLPNLKKMHEMGVQEWVKKEEERWRCSRCGLPMSWYDAECIGCGEKRSERVFSLG